MNTNTGLMQRVKRGEMLPSEALQKLMETARENGDSPAIVKQTKAYKWLSVRYGNTKPTCMFTPK